MKMLVAIGELSQDHCEWLYPVREFFSLPNEYSSVPSRFAIKRNVRLEDWTAKLLREFTDSTR